MHKVRNEESEKTNRNGHYIVYGILESITLFVGNTLELEILLLNSRKRTISRKKPFEKSPFFQEISGLYHRSASMDGEGNLETLFTTEKKLCVKEISLSSLLLSFS